MKSDFLAIIILNNEYVLSNLFLNLWNYIVLF